MGRRAMCNEFYSDWDVQRKRAWICEFLDRCNFLYLNVDFRMNTTFVFVHDAPDVYFLMRCSGNGADAALTYAATHTLELGSSSFEINQKLKMAL